MFNSNHERMVKKAGGTYIGTCEGMVWFNAPSGSTCVCNIKQASVELVKQHLAEDAERWRKARVA